MLKLSNICCKHITYNGLLIIYCSYDMERYGTPYQTIILLGKTRILISFRNSLRPTILDKCIATWIKLSEVDFYCLAAHIFFSFLLLVFSNALNSRCSNRKCKINNFS